MNGVRHGEILIAADDEQILIVVVGGLVAQVVAAGDDGASLWIQGIDHDDLVMNDGMPRGQKLRMQVAERCMDGRGPNHGNAALLARRPPNAGRWNVHLGFWTTRSEE